MVDSNIYKLIFKQTPNIDWFTWQNPKHSMHIDYSAVYPHLHTLLWNGNTYLYTYIQFVEEKLVVKWKEIASLPALLLYINCYTDPYMETFLKTDLEVLAHIELEKSFITNILLFIIELGFVLSHFKFNKMNSNLIFKKIIQ